MYVCMTHTHTHRYTSSGSTKSAPAGKSASSPSGDRGKIYVCFRQNVEAEMCKGQSIKIPVSSEGCAGCWPTYDLRVLSRITRARRSWCGTPTRV